MDLTRFKKSLEAKAPPKRLSLALEALWWDAQGDWDKAHDRAQQQEDEDGAWVHAYLHRKEGDLTNARYWYRRAGKSPSTSGLAAEWQAIARALLKGADAQ